MKEIKEYLSKIDGVSHVTLNPNGPGVVRIHLIPPEKPKMGISWVVILNGQDILPINAAWAMLLKMFIDEISVNDGKELSEEDIKIIIDNTVDNAKKVFVKTNKKILKGDLKQIIDTLVKIAQGKTPNKKIGYITLKDYYKYMKAPHRMDLMISSMMKNNCWNCNQKCLHCYAGTQENAITEELSTEQWKQVIDKLKKACIPQITFTGGEPTLRDDLIELVKYSSWFVTRLNTNGIKLTKALCEDLYDASLDSVQVTLYSGDEKIHNILVGANHFADTVEGLKNAINSHLNVSINTPLCSINKDYLSTIKFAEALGVKYFTCSGIIITGNATASSAENTHLTNQEMLDILKEACAYCEEHHLEISFTSPGWVDEKELRKLKLVVPTCGACLSNMAIAPNGEVIPCQSWLSNNNLGNILTSSFASIFNSKVCKEIRKKAALSNNICQLNELRKEVK